MEGMFSSVKMRQDALCCIIVIMIQNCSGRPPFPPGYTVVISRPIIP